MKLIKIYSQGKVINSKLYTNLQKLDIEVFPGCEWEFKENRDWWVITIKNKIIAYCGSLYSDNVCLFVRAWVDKKYRGKGLQRKMINTRIKAAKNYAECIVTYCTPNNYSSANNLIKCKFLLHNPHYKYAGEGMLYFKRLI
jgi:RimJ/RimL family protein N-acetyltransferase